MARFLTGLFGSNKPTQPPATSLRVNTSLQGAPIPLLLGGQQRLGGNLIAYFQFFFQNTPPSGGGGGKGGVFGSGGKGQGGNVNYFVSVIIGIAEGPDIAGLGNIWVNGSLNKFPPGNEQLAFFAGDYAQPPWGYALAVDPPVALPYRGLAYAGFSNYPLGSSPSLPNFTFELISTNSGFLPGQPDGDPTVALTRFLTSPFYGIGFPPARLANLAAGPSSWQAYCRAIGFAVSPVIASPVTASSVANDLVTATNSNACWQDGQLTVVPYGDSPVQVGQVATIAETHVVPAPAVPGSWSFITVGNNGSFVADDGVTYQSGVRLQGVGTFVAPTQGQYNLPAAGVYLFNAADAGQTVLITYSYAATGSYVPDIVPLYDFTLDDFLPNQGSIGSGIAGANAPVIVVRKPRDQMLNNIRVEYLDRNNAYNPVITERKNEAAITFYGRERPSDVKQLHLFCLASAAQQSATLQLIRQEVARTFQFTVGKHFTPILSLMKLVTVTDPGQGLSRQPCRIIEIQENNDFSLTVTAEEFLGTVSAPLYGSEAGIGFIPNYNADPGPINQPIIFEPTDELASALVPGGGLMIAGAISGVNKGLWGGAVVWASYEEAGTYERIGEIFGPARMGVLSAPLPPVGVNATGPTIDQTSTLDVDLTESGATLGSGTTQDATALNTRCYVGPAVGGGRGEIVAYATATLTAANKYALSYLIRGAYGTEAEISFWVAGTPFVRLDRSIFVVPFDQSRIGQTIYLKFTAFNIYQGGEQNLGDVGAYAYTITGAALYSPLPPVKNLRTFFANGFTNLSWDEVDDFRPVRYEIRIGDSVASALSLGTVAHPPFAVPGDGEYWVAAVSEPAAGRIVYSETWQSATISGAVITENVVLTYDLKANGWPGTFSGGAGVDNIINAIRTGAVGNILADPDFLNTPDILNFGGAGGGAYFPANVFLDIGYVTTASVAIRYKPTGVPVGQNILGLPNILDQADMLGSASTQFILVTPQINTATSPGGDLYAQGDLYQYPDLYITGSVNWNGFQSFTPGQYQTRYLDFAMALATRDPNTIAYDLEFVITVTIPGRIDQVPVTTGTGGTTTVTFAAPFNGGAGIGNTPVVQATIINAAGGDDLVVTSITRTGCHVAVQNTGNLVARTVYLQVEGF
jgi:hypothetical protein